MHSTKFSAEYIITKSNVADRLGCKSVQPTPALNSGRSEPQAGVCLLFDIFSWWMYVYTKCCAIIKHILKLNIAEITICNPRAKLWVNLGSVGQINWVPGIKTEILFYYRIRIEIIYAVKNMSQLAGSSSVTERTLHTKLLLLSSETTVAYGIMQ